jgi:hypothetical protein
MEIRYTLGREDHGTYTYAIFTHEPSYGATNIGESRYGFKLNSKVFDWLSVDQQRNEIMPNGYDWDQGTDLNMKEARRLTTGVHKGRAEHKYDYCADQFDTPAFGWSSTKDHIGLRLGIAGVSARSIDVGVNGKPAGRVDGLVYNATINRDGVEGSWVEKDVSFDTALFHPGQNTMTLTVPAGGLTSGVAYDVLRLEMVAGQ